MRIAGAEFSLVTVMRVFLFLVESKANLRDNENTRFFLFLFFCFLRMREHLRSYLTSNYVNSVSVKLLG